MTHNFNPWPHYSSDGPVPAHRHPNGGGWVAESATVADTAYVGPNAKVYGHATVVGCAEIRDITKVYGNARVSGHAQVYGAAEIYDRAMIFGHAQVCDYAWAWRGVKVGGYAVVQGTTKIHKQSRISGLFQAFSIAGRLSGEDGWTRYTPEPKTPTTEAPALAPKKKARGKPKKKKPYRRMLAPVQEPNSEEAA